MKTSLQPPLPDSPRPQAPHLKQILITLVCGVLLAGGSCFGFLNTMNFNGPSKTGNALFAIGFVVGVALVVSVAVRALYGIIVYLIRMARGEQ